jgi:transposase InsO family protein
VIPDDWNVAHLDPQLRCLERIYGTVRPHQALGYLTPHEFLERRRSQPKNAECH